MYITAAKLRTLPDTPGVYFFLGPKTRKAYPYGSLSTGVKGRCVLYIGKAGSLRDRVRSYFSRDVVETRGAGIKQMIENAEDIHFQKTDSVLEAVLLEAELIKKYQPKYNVREKDDKSFNYVVITNEDFPRILLVRGKELTKHGFGEKPNKKISINLKSKIINLKLIFGPFPHGATLREALAIIRKIFPYRDACVPSASRSYSSILQNTRITNRKKNIPANHANYSNVLENIGIRRGCFNRQIGLCPGVCTGEISKKEYGKIIRNIALLFKGRKKAVLNTLAHEMKAAARNEDFERAAKLRNTIRALEHIQDVSLIKRESFINPHHIYGRSSVYIVGGVRRIEAYDIAHTSGKEIVGVMVAVSDGEPDKNAYRKFILRTVLSSNDPAALKEVLERRLTHAEWPFPGLVVVDGGKAQVNVATHVLAEAGVPARVVGVVKDERHRPKQIIGDKELSEKLENEILLANSEAHRFAISFHRERMRRR